MKRALEITKMKGRTHDGKRIYDEKNGLWYELQGDYYLPCSSLSEKEHKEISVWGQRSCVILRSIKELFMLIY